MSYILEALKKSERERAKGNIPTLETVSDTGVSRRALWLGVLLGAGALLLVVLAAWLVSAQFFRSDSSTSPPVTAGTAPHGGVDEPAARTDDPPAQTEAPRSEPETRPAIDDREPQPPQRVAEVSELDAGAQARVRDLSVNVVSYSQQPERRFVMLNQRIFRESDMVADGVIVKEILPEGVLLRVDDHEIVIGAD